MSTIVPKEVCDALDEAIAECRPGDWQIAVKIAEARALLDHEPEPEADEKPKPKPEPKAKPKSGG